MDINTFQSGFWTIHLWLVSEYIFTPFSVNDLVSHLTWVLLLGPMTGTGCDGCHSFWPQKIKALWGQWGGCMYVYVLCCLRVYRSASEPDTYWTEELENTKTSIVSKLWSPNVEKGKKHSWRRIGLSCETKLQILIMIYPLYVTLSIGYVEFGKLLEAEILL